MYVKVCGLRTPRDVATAVEAGADAVGFVLTGSPRQVTAAQARTLATGIPEGVLSVAVFRGEPIDVVRGAVTDSGVRAVQLHGDEPQSHYTALRELGVQLVRATAASSGVPIRCGDLGEDLLIVDSPQPGSGVEWAWDALAPGAVTGRWLLAGGLHCDNVGAAVRAVGPWGVDVSSGVESSRGVKDPLLIRRFVTAAKAAG